MIGKMIYFLEEGFHNIFKSKVEALSSITTITMCIFIMGIMYMTLANVSSTVQKIQDDLNLLAYLDTSTSRANAEALQKHVATNENVLSIELYTKEEALVEFASEIENGENLLEQYKDDNPLRDSLRIKLKDPNKQEEVLKMLEDSSFVKKIIKPNDAVKFLTSLNTTVKIGSFFFIAVLIFMSVILIINTIKLTVMMRKNDIQIMKYIGATDWFVRLPFIVEGILIGLIGTIIPLLVLHVIYSCIIDMIHNNQANTLANIIALVPMNEIYMFLIPLAAIIGIGIGTVGSVISIRKYLDV